MRITVLQTAIMIPILALFVDVLLGGQGRIVAPWERAFTAWLYRRAWWVGPMLLVVGSTACAVSSERPLGVIGFGALAVVTAAVIVFGRPDWQATEASAPIVVQRSRRHFRKVGVTDGGRWKRVLFLGAAALASPTLAWLSRTQGCGHLPVGLVVSELAVWHLSVLLTPIVPRPDVDVEGSSPTS